jgi:hypothetical protein
MGRPLCLAVVVALTVTITMAFATQAFATNESKLCSGGGSCTHVTNNENWIKNVESYNLSGKGTCDYLWYWNGASWEKLINRCNSKEEGQLWCLSGYEVMGHGETTRTFEFLYELFNRQDNFKECR